MLFRDILVLVATADNINTGIKMICFSCYHGIWKMITLRAYLCFPTYLGSGVFIEYCCYCGLEVREERGCYCLVLLSPERIFCCTLQCSWKDIWYVCHEWDRRNRSRKHCYCDPPPFLTLQKRVLKGGLIQFRKSLDLLGTRECLTQYHLAGSNHENVGQAVR